MGITHFISQPLFNSICWPCVHHSSWLYWRSGRPAPGKKVIRNSYELEIFSTWGEIEIEWGEQIDYWQKRI